MKWDLGWVLNWSIVYLCNLPVPFLFGMAFTTGLGRLGMFIAIPVLWFLGIALVLFPGRFRIAFCTGAVPLIFSQLFLVVHIVLGSLALKSVQLVTGQPFQTASIDSFPAGFAATVLMAQFLATVCLIVGYPITVHFNVRDPVGMTTFLRSGQDVADETVADDPLPE